MTTDDLKAVSFFAEGHPRTKGSWRVTPSLKAGKPRFRPDNPRVKGWEALVDLRAAEAMGGRDPWSGPVSLRLEFRVPRPPSHLTGSGAVRPGFPAMPVLERSGDLDKLERAVLDALTSRVYRTDAQVVSMEAVKVYVDDPKAGGVVVNAGQWPFCPRWAP